MFPVLLRIGDFTIYSYGVMLFVAFLVGFWQVVRRAWRFGVSPQQVTGLALLAIVAGVVGARLFYVALHWGEFRYDLVSIVAFWRGGLSGMVFFGGALAVFAVILVYALVKKLPKLKMLDAIAPAIVLGQGITRIGCFLNGCCFGKPTNLPVGVVFPANSGAGRVFPGQPIHPTQLYSSIAGFALFILALWLERRNLKDGVLWAILVVLTSLFRFLVDFLRHYENGANFWSNQVVAIGLIAFGAVCFVVLLRRKSSPFPCAGPNE